MLSSSPQAVVGRIRGLVLMLGAIVALSVWAPSAARASGCTNTWTNTKGGSWFEGSNWSKKTVPTSTEEACITEAGSYVVTMTQTSGTVTLKSLTVGASSGTQTLIVGSSSSVNAILTTTAGISQRSRRRAHDDQRRQLGQQRHAGRPGLQRGPAGSEQGVGGNPHVRRQPHEHRHRLDLHEPSFSGANALTNEGTLNLAEGKTLTVSSKEGSVTNGTGGKIIATGSGMATCCCPAANSPRAPARPAAPSR